MSRKRILHEHILYNDVIDDVTTNATSVEGLDHYSYLVKFSTAPAGEFFVDGSNDGEIWNTLDFNGALLADEIEDSFEFAIREINYKFTRFRFENNGSAGTMSVSIFGKTVGA